MKALFIFAILCHALPASAQWLEKRIDKKTGDTSISTRPVILQDKSVPYTTANYLQYYIRRIALAHHHGIVYEIRLHIIRYRVVDFFIGKQNDAMITFTDRQLLHLSFKAFNPSFENESALDNIPLRPGYNVEAVYALTARDIASLASDMVSSLRVETTSGTLFYAIKPRRAEILKKNAALIAGIDKPGSI